MSKLIYAKSKAGFELAYTPTQRADGGSIFRSIAFLEDGYLWTHGTYFRTFVGTDPFTSTVSNNTVTIKDPTGITFVTFDRGIHSIVGTSPITASTTEGVTTIVHDNSTLAASTLGASAASADSIVVPKIVTDSKGHLVTGTTQFTATLNQVKTNLVSTGADQYIAFAAASATDTSELNKAIGLKYNPETGVFTAGVLSGTLSNSLTITLNNADTVFNNSTNRSISIFSPTNAGNIGEILQNVSGLPTWVPLSQGISAASSHTEIPTAKAVFSAINAGIGANDAMIFKGVIDASANPNYPAGSTGETYKISVAGKIGGALGPKVEVGDMIICVADNTAAGTHATVGGFWTIVQADIDGAVTYTTPATNTVVGHLPVFSTTNGVGITTSEAMLSTFGKSLVSSAPTANTVLGIGTSNNVTSYTTSGTGTRLALTTSPSFTTPSLGVATASSINKVTITAPATSAVLTIANGKTLTVNNTVTFSGNESITVALGVGGTVAYTGNHLGSFVTTTSAQLAGVISDEIGTGRLVFNTSPTFIGDVTFDTAGATHDRIVISPNATSTAAFTGNITSSDLTAAQTWTLPNASGTIALTSDTVNLASNISGGVAGDLLYQSGPNVTAKLSGAAGKILAYIGTAPKWTDRDSIVFASTATSKANGAPVDNKIFLNLYDSESGTARSSVNLQVAGSLAMSGSAGAITITGTNTWRNVSAYKLTSGGTLSEVLNTTIGGHDLQFGSEFLWDESNVADPELKLAWAEVNVSGVVTYAV